MLTLAVKLEDRNNDIALFNRLREGQRLALNTLFVNYYESLCRFAFSFVKNKQEAEELVNDVFLQLWRKREHISIEHSVKAYLFASVRHASLAMLQKKVIVFDSLDDVLQHPQETITPEQETAHSELTLLVAQALENLPERTRQVFLLSRFENLKYAEIAQTLALSEKTVEGHITKALAHLRECLRKYYPSVTVSR